MSNHMPAKKPTVEKVDTTSPSLIPDMVNPPAYDPVEAAKMAMPSITAPDASMHPSHLLPKPEAKPKLGKTPKIETPPAKTKTYRVTEERRASISGGTHLFRKGKIIDEAHYNPADISRLREQGVQLELVEDAKA